MLDLTPEERRLRTREAEKRYKQSAKGKETRRRRERTPEYKEKKRLYDNAPEQVAARKARNAAPERKAADRKRWLDPKRREYLASLRETPAAREWQKQYDRRPTRVEGRRRRGRARLPRLYKQRCKCCPGKVLVAYYDVARSARLQVDHVEPIALGGLHCLKNLQMLTVEQHKAKTKNDFARMAEVRRSTLE